jgi:hypothetical protein
MGTEAFWVPMAMGGMGALGGALGGEGSKDQLGFGQAHGQPDPRGIGEWSHIFPPTLLANYLSNVEQMGAIATGIASQPVTLPGTQVQQPGWYGGAGMVAPVGLSAMDIANIRPSVLGTPGIRTGEPDPAAVARRRVDTGTNRLIPFDWGTSDPRHPAGRADARDKREEQFREYEMTKYLFPGAPRETPEAQVETFKKPFAEGGQFQAALPEQQGLRQPSPSQIRPGGGFSELYGALKLLGVETDPMGNLTVGSEYPLFTGASRTPPPVPGAGTTNGGGTVA